MLQLAIPIPNIKGKQEIEIDMVINDTRQKMRFIVDVYPWDDCQPMTDNRIDCIRELISDYGDDWMIYNIGLPTDDYVPLTFVHKEDWLRQRELLMEAVTA
ncbi:MAG: hypothetical protein KTR24_04635 [Saprospiraceae bacterium]|nr:hypothetical protein [Saprospiraceae bacterium]